MDLSYNVLQATQARLDKLDGFSVDHLQQSFAMDEAENELQYNEQTSEQTHRFQFNLQKPVSGDGYTSGWINYGTIDINTNAQQTVNCATKGFELVNVDSLFNQAGLSTILIYGIISYNPSGQQQSSEPVNTFYHFHTLFTNPSQDLSSIVSLQGSRRFMIGTIDNVSGSYSFHEAKLYGYYFTNFYDQISKPFSVYVLPKDGINYIVYHDKLGIDNYTFGANGGYVYTDKGSINVSGVISGQTINDPTFIYAQVDEGSLTGKIIFEEEEKPYFDEETKFRYILVGKYEMDHSPKLTQYINDNICFDGNDKVRVLSGDYGSDYLSAKLDMPLMPSSEVSSYVGAFMGYELTSSEVQGIPSAYNYKMKPYWKYQSIPSYSPSAYQTIANVNGDLLWDDYGKVRIDGEDTPAFLDSKIVGSIAIIKTVDGTNVKTMKFKLGENAIQCPDNSLEVQYDSINGIFDIEDRGYVRVCVEDQDHYLSAKFPTNDNIINFGVKSPGTSLNDYQISACLGPSAIYSSDGTIIAKNLSGAYDLSVSSQISISGSLADALECISGKLRYKPEFNASYRTGDNSIIAEDEAGKLTKWYWRRSGSQLDSVFIWHYPPANNKGQPQQLAPPASSALTPYYVLGGNASYGLSFLKYPRETKLSGSITNVFQIGRNASDYENIYLRYQPEFNASYNDWKFIAADTSRQLQVKDLETLIHSTSGTIGIDFEKNTGRFDLNVAMGEVEDELLDNDEFMYHLAHNETFVSSLIQNHIFTMNLGDNEFFVTNLVNNQIFVEKLCENTTFINTLVSAMFTCNGLVKATDGTLDCIPIGTGYAKGNGSTISFIPPEQCDS